VHDCFHGPMGHTLDLIRDALWGPKAGDRIDKYLLKKHIGLKAGFIWDSVLRYVADSEKECIGIFEILKELVASPSSLGDKAFLAEIVDGDLDSDRIDYIWRDHTHLEMTTLEKKDDVRPLINSVLPIKVVTRVPSHTGIAFGDAVEETGKSETHLYFSVGYQEVVRVLLEKRVEFYRRYYEHPLKLVSDEMLVHAIYYALREAGILLSAGGTVAGFADEFSFLTDEGLIGFLMELTSWAGYEIPSLLLRDFRTNSNFEIVYSRSLPRNKLSELRLRDMFTRGNLTV
jgi:HD superfamily phosphohydrolase